MANPEGWARSCQPISAPSFIRKGSERMPDIYKAVAWAKKIAEDNTHGYDQDHRNGPDYDCSSLVSTALNIGGFDISPESWTGNMYSQLKRCGWTQLPINAPRRMGDVFLTPRKHTVICLDADRVITASINEKGSAHGGKSGDQTGAEIYIRPYYEPSYGWTYHLRWTATRELHIVARDVIRGKYGNGNARKKALRAAGYKYEEVQALVNKMLKGGL